MAEICKNTLLPESLIMRRCECFYCGVENEGAVLIEYTFGIKVCKIHRQRGERDCKAYLHREGWVRIEDAMEIPVLKRFLDVLEAHPQLAVERTNGLLENDWSFRKGNHFEPAFFSRNQDRWGVPMYCKRIDQNKTVPVINFLRLDINGQMNLPEDWHALIEGVIDTLKEGLYKSEAEAYDNARNHDDSETITETAGVTGIIYNGRTERIFVGHLGEGRARENGTDRTNEVEEICDPS